nr:type II toxin-antitoxin system RnlB family antitoxin [uncultured Flavobacterium sp.]
MENNKYILQKTENNEFGFLALSIDYSRLDEYIYDVEKELKKKKYIGKIVFDLLVNNGINDRFYSCLFDGQKILLGSLSSIKNLDNDIQKASSNFYLSNFDIINNSYISKQSKFLIKKKLLSTSII